MQHVPLLVLGADLDGLAAALSLAHQGFPVHVLDRGPDPLEAPGDVPPEPAGAVQLGPQACGELAALGLDELLEDAVEPQRMLHDDAVTGRTLREVGLGRAVRKRFGQPLLAVGRARLRRGLALACASDDTITVEYRRRPAVVRDVVEAVLVGDEEAPRYRAEALVAADGADTRVRALLGGGALASMPYASYTTPWRGPDPGEEVRHWSSPVLHATRTPTADGASLGLLAPADLAPHEVRQALGHHAPELADVLAPALDAAPQRVHGHHQPLSRWTRHRITVLGSAAQPMLPHHGLEFGQTLLDAAALGAAFDRCDGRILEALERYERARAVPRAWAATHADEFAALCHAEGLTRRLRDRLWTGVAPDELAEAVGEAG